ncbi:MAG: hypothetical protein LBU32_04080 [Clostridiales bacterium]|jgi:hypothetical protein|nr:hypothetical protein [Clostridiales bacterium]
MDSLASGDCRGAEAVAEEGRIGEFNLKLCRTDKTQLISILSDDFIRIFRIAATRLAGESAKIIRQMSKETSAWDPGQPCNERKNPLSSSGRLILMERKSPWPQTFRHLAQSK